MTQADRVGIIFAFDSNVFGHAEQILFKEIGPHIDFVKVGLQAMTAEDPNRYHRTIASLVREFTLDVLEKEVMWDMKLHDVGNTVEQAALNIGVYGSSMFTLHAAASPAALMAAARESAKQQMLALAVTVLTDLDDADCTTMFMQSPDQAVEVFARRAHGHGITGFVCSAHEAAIIRSVAPASTIVTPAIRPRWSVRPDEQKRIMTPTQAAKAGADHIVIGRPISKPPQGMSSLEAVKLVRAELDGKLPPGIVVDRKA